MRNHNVESKTQNLCLFEPSNILNLQTFRSTSNIIPKTKKNDFRI